jgi:hypothetical protein
MNITLQYLLLVVTIVTITTEILVVASRSGTRCLVYNTLALFLRTALVYGLKPPIHELVLFRINQHNLLIQKQMIVNTKLLFKKLIVPSKTNKCINNSSCP